jgi:hypothetical protein
MPKQKFPSNLVQAPVFDSPLRRTEPRVSEPAVAGELVPIAVLRRPEVSEPADLSPMIQTRRGAATEPQQERVGGEGRAAAAPEQDSEPDLEQEQSPDLLLHRTTLRLPQDVHDTLEREAFERRMRGERTNPAAIAREVLARWARRRRDS